MEEIWDCYNEKRKKIGKDILRNKPDFKDGEFHIVEEVWIINLKGEILLTQRSKNKKEFPLKWECTAGSILKGENTVDGALREVSEEIGVHLNKEDLIYLEQKIDRRYHAIVDKWIVRKDILLSSLKFSDREVQDAKYVSIDEFKSMMDRGDIRDTFEYIYDKYDYILNLKQRESYDFLGKEVEVTIDRKLGSHHPKHKEMIYPINYGYVANTISGDGEELDVYVIDSKVPEDKVKGICIGVLQRIEEADDKLIVVENENKKYSIDEINDIVDFQEKYFSSLIINN